MARRRPATPPKIPNATYLSFLGSGGFADVYLYEQQIPHREVAIKVLRRGVADVQKESFRTEANLMARLSSHPSVVSVYGAGETEDERMYLIMEYCPPPHLGARVRQRPFTVPHALEVGVQIAGAIETLHRAGVVHRDIKPSNVLMTPFQRPVLTDFGIATDIGDASPAEGFSVPWAPPEQATGEGAAAVTVDVYSLAATVYTFLAGRPPFEVKDGDNSEIAVINRVLRAPVPSTGRTDVPDELERVLAIAMSKAPGQRYASVIEFATALQAIQVALHQRPTEIDVLSDANPNPPAEDDSDTTRQAIRTIDPLKDDSTRLSPMRIVGGIRPAERGPFADGPDPRQARGRAGGPVGAARGGGFPAKQPGRGRDEIGWLKGGVRDSDSSKADVPPRKVANGSAEEGGERAEDEPTPLGVMITRFFIAAVMVLAITVGIIATVRHGKGATIEPTGKEPTTGFDPGVSDVQPVVGIRGRVEGDRVVFTWTNPDPRPGDTYLYRPSLLTGNERVRDTKATEVSVAKQTPQTCLEVTVHRTGGKESKPVQTCVNSP